MENSVLRSSASSHVCLMASVLSLLKLVPALLFYRYRFVLIKAELAALKYAHLNLISVQMEERSYLQIPHNRSSWSEVWVL